MSEAEHIARSVPAASTELRVLVLPPTARDGTISMEVLRRYGIEAEAFDDLHSLCVEARRGAGAVLVTLESIIADRDRSLRSLLDEAPAWSDLPIIVLTAGADSPQVFTSLHDLGNVTIVRRPVQLSQLTSTVRAALRDRDRQYLMRNYLRDQDRHAALLGAAKDDLAFALDAGSLGTWELDLKSGGIRCSPLCQTHLGLLRADGLRREDLLESVHADDRERVEAAMTFALAENAAYDVEYRTVWPNGTTHWVLIRGRISRDATGEPIRLLGVSLDITAQKETEEALRRNESRLKFLAELDRALGAIDEPSEVAAAASRLLRGHLALGACVYAEISNDLSVATALGSSCPGPAMTELRLDALSDELSICIRRGIPFLKCSEASLSRTGRAFGDLLGAEVEAIAAVPSRRSNGRMALLIAGSKSSRRWSSTDVELIQLVASRCGESIDRANNALNLRASEQRYRELAVNVPQLFWTCLPNGECDYLSKQWEDYTGVPAKHQLGLGWLHLVIHPDDRERALATWMSAVNDTGVYDLEYRIKGADDRYRWFKTRGSPIRDETGKIVRWFGTCTEIDAQVRAEEALRIADRRKDEFLAMLAHELRNPLAAVNGAVAVLKRTKDEDTRQWASEIVERQVRQLTHLIDDLLDVSRITTGKIRLRLEQIDAGAVLDRSIEDAMPLIERRRHELVTAIEHGRLPLEADPTRLEQIVLNLLSNAAKYTEVGGTIYLTAVREGDSVVITVADTGMGIPPEKLPQMFELFTQGERSLARSEGGLGIGLTIVKRLTEMHGGSISAASEGVGRGSRFVVRLPAAAAAPLPSPEPVRRLPASGSRAKILIVDDNIDTAGAMMQLLKLLGNDVRTAHDGFAAVEETREFRPEYVLLDIGLPGMDGYEVAAAIRSDPLCRDTVIIGVSGYGQEDDRRRAKDAGFDHHLVKPVDFDALISLISGPPLM